MASFPRRGLARHGFLVLLFEQCLAAQQPFVLQAQRSQPYQQAYVTELAPQAQLSSILVPQMRQTPVVVQMPNMPQSQFVQADMQAVDGTSMMQQQGQESADTEVAKLKEELTKARHEREQLANRLQEQQVCKALQQQRDQIALQLMASENREKALLREREQLTAQLTEQRTQARENEKKYKEQVEQYHGGRIALMQQQHEQLQEQLRLKAKEELDRAKQERGRLVEDLNLAQQERSTLALSAQQAQDNIVRLSAKVNETAQRLNASDVMILILRRQLVEARNLLNTSTARLNVSAGQLEVAESRSRQLQRMLVEERSDRQREALASKELLRQRDSDKAFLETSSRLLRGGEARLRQAAQEVQQAKEQLERQRNETSRAEAKAQKEEFLLKQSLGENRLLQEKLEARGKRLTLLPWAELLDRCKQDVCFTLAHRVACCGGPKEELAQRPAACDLAARVASGDALAPPACLDGGANSIVNERV